MAIVKEIRELDEDWKYGLVSHLVGGMNRSLADHLIEDEEALTILNLTSNARKLLGIDTGYSEFGPTVRGTPQRVFDFGKSDGTIQYIGVTTDTVYVWSSGKQEWQYISDSIDTTVAAQAVATNTNIQVVSSTGFTVADFVGIELDDGTQHQTTIASIPDGTHITAADAIPTGRTAEVGAVFVKAVDLNGTKDFWVDGCNVPTNDWFVFTNNIDQPMRLDGTDCVPVPNLPSAPNFKAKTVNTFENYLLFGWCTEGGTERPWRIRRCDTADPTNWSTGNAGFDDLLDGDDGVLRLQNLGTVCVAYRGASITLGVAVNTEDKIIQWVTRVRGEGVISTGGVADIGDEHVVFGTTTIYKYRGGFDIDPILVPLQDFLFSSQGELNPLQGHRSFAFYILEYNEVWCIYPEVGSDDPNKIVRYSLSTEKWFVRRLTDGMTGIGVNINDLARTWSSLVGDWPDQVWTWGSKQLLSNSPTIMLCGASTNQIYAYDYLSTTDNGDALPWMVESKDFINPQDKVRVDLLDTYMRGTDIFIEYSIDGGQSWVPIGTFSPGTTIQRVRSTFAQIVCHQIRFRWSGTGGGFAMGWFGFVFKEESET